MLAKTKDTREKLLKWFDDWLQSQGMTLEALLDPKSFDVETINIVLSMQWGLEDQICAGFSKGHGT